MHANNLHSIPEHTPSEGPHWSAEEASGGVLRISAAPVPQQPQQSPVQSLPEASRVHGGTLRHTMGTETVESAAVARHVVTHEGTRGGSVMATVRQDGPARTVELVPGEPSSRTTIAVALREGVIKEVQPGIYADVAGTLQQVEQALQGDQQGPAEAQTAEDPAQAIFDAADAQLFAEAVEPLPQHAFDAAAAGAMLATTLGNSLGDTAITLARNAGIDVQQAREVVEQGVALHEAALARALAPLGLVGERKDAFYEWARNDPRGLQEALEALVHHRDPAGFLRMAGRFAKENPGDLSGWHRAGFETHVTDTGEVLVKRPGTDWLNPAALAKQR